MLLLLILLHALPVKRQAKVRLAPGSTCDSNVYKNNPIIRYGVQMLHDKLRNHYGTHPSFTAIGLDNTMALAY